MSNLLDLHAKSLELIDKNFYKLLEAKINISSEIRSEASVSQNRVRNNFNSENERDNKFPKVLSKSDNDFLGGSFARHTKILPLDDIDIYFPLDGQGFTYTTETYEKFAVASDNPYTTNPLLEDRWANGQNVSSSKLIVEFNKVLKKWYPNSDVKKNGQAVTVRLSSVAVGDDGPGLGFDIVPCFLIYANNSSEHNFYVIPNGANGWIRTNPRVDKNINDSLQEYHQKRFRPLVKLIKYWNAKNLNSNINSYYIELALMRYFYGKPPISSIHEGLYEGIVYLAKCILSNTEQSPWIKDAPLVKAGEVTDRQRMIINEASVTAKEANDLFRALKFSESLEKWKLIFREL